MSEFSGRMREYKQISIDRFDGQNLKSTAFFLSHCHKDHMTGLDSPNFIKRLQSRPDMFLYCTEISKILLLAEPVYRPLEKYIKVLISEESERISLPDPSGSESTEILVTPLPALHCPGSVMFLFEGDEGTVLYTGDFRWETNHAINISSFKTGESLKEIESMYIDTTFCVESAFHFPSRVECCDVSCNIVNDWLSRSDQHYIHITSKTNYGHESLMKALHLSTGFKIHVPEWKFNIYGQISELRDVFTTDPTARIHACNRVQDKAPESKLPCGFIPSDGQEIQVRSIRPSTMFFTMGHHNIEPDSLHVVGRNLHRVCYSFHSSYSEIRDVVMYLKPKRVIPNVKPAPDKDMRQVQQRLNTFLKLPHRLHFSSPHKNLGKLKHRRNFKSVRNKELTDSEDLVFNSQSSVKGAKNTVLKSHEKPDDSSDVTTPTKMSDSQVSSSYEPSIVSGEELSLVESSEDDDDDGHGCGQPEDDDGCDVGLEGEGGDTEESLRLYVSGDDEVDEDERVSTLNFTQSCQEESQKTRDGREVTCGDQGEITFGDTRKNVVGEEVERMFGQGEGIVVNKGEGTYDSEGQIISDITGNSIGGESGGSIGDKREVNCCEGVKGEITTENSKSENKLKAVLPDHCGLRIEGVGDLYVSAMDSVGSGDSNEKSDKNSADNENGAIKFSGKHKVCDDTNENNTKSLPDKDNHDVMNEHSLENNEGEEYSMENLLNKHRNPEPNMYKIGDHNDCNKGNRMLLVSETDSISEDPNQNKNTKLHCFQSLDKCKNSEKSSEVVSFRTDHLTHESEISEESHQDNLVVTNLMSGQPLNSNVAVKENTNTAVSNCTVNSENNKSLFPRINSFDLFEEDAGVSVQESQGFDPQCLTTDLETNDFKKGDSGGFSHCSDGMGDDAQKAAETMTNSKGVLSGGDSRSSLEGVDRVELVFSGQSENEVCNTELKSKSDVFSDITVSSNGSSHGHEQNKSVNEEVDINGCGVESRNDVNMAHPLQSPSVEKTQLSIKDNLNDQSSLTGDDTSECHEESEKCENNHEKSNTDDKTSGQRSKSSSISGEEQNDVYDGDSEDNNDYDDSDVVVIDLSDSDSQEPPRKRWRPSCMGKSGSSYTRGARASTSGTRSVLDHLQKLRSVLHGEQDSDSDTDITQPPTGTSLSGSCSNSDVQVISDDEEDMGEEEARGQSLCLSQQLLMTSGWYNARSGGSRHGPQSNRRCEGEEVCIDLTGDDD